MPGPLWATTSASDQALGQGQQVDRALDRVERAVFAIPLLIPFFLFYLALGWLWNLGSSPTPLTSWLGLEALFTPDVCPA